MQTRNVRALVVSALLFCTTTGARAESLEVTNRLAEPAGVHRSVVLRSVVALPGDGHHLLAAISTGERAYQRAGFEFWLVDLASGTISRQPLPGNLLKSAGINARSAPRLVAHSARDVTIVFQTHTGVVLAAWQPGGAFEVRTELAPGEAVLDAVSTRHSGSAILTGNQLLFMDSNLDLAAAWQAPQTPRMNLISIAPFSAEDHSALVIGNDGTALQLWRVNRSDAERMGSVAHGREGAHLARALMLGDRTCLFKPGIATTTTRCWSSRSDASPAATDSVLASPGLQTMARLGNGRVLLASAQMSDGPLQVYRMSGGELVENAGLERVSAGTGGLVFNTELVALTDGSAAAAYTFVAYDEQTRRENFSIQFARVSLAED